MSPPNLVQRGANLGLKLATTVAFLAPLLTRITLGYTFFLTGRGKIENPEFFQNLVSLIADRGIPFPELNAHIVARLEYYGGIALALGLLTRLTSLALAGSMVVALLPERERFFSSWMPDFPQGPTDFSEWVFLLFFAWLMFYGPGAVSADALLKKWLRIGPPEAPAAKGARS